MSAYEVGCVLFGLFGPVLFLVSYRLGRIANALEDIAKRPPDLLTVPPQVLEDPEKVRGR